jgi:3',5'-cyclic AMP phosphodiesterase CpdA
MPVRLITDSPTCTHTVIQLSDTHIVPEGKLYHDVVDTLANVAAAFDQLERSSIEASALVLSGDLADAGDLPSYRRLRSYVERRAGALGFPVLYVMGNHDSRGPFREGLLGAEPTTEPYDYVFWSGDLRIVVLDSTEPGEALGALSDEQLAWLAAELATPAPAGTIVVLHHPPIPSPIGMLNSMVLEGPERLGAVLAGTDARIVLCGHAHHASAGVLGGVPVWVAGATAYAANTLRAAGGYTGVTGGLFTRIDVFAGQAVATAIPTTPGDAIYELTPDMLAKYAADFGPELTHADLDALTKA